MPAHRKPFSMDHPVVIMLVLFAVIAFMYQASAVLKPLALAILLSFALVPISRLLERVHVPRIPAVVITVLLVMGSLGFVGYHVGDQLNGLVTELPRYEGNVRDKIKAMQPKKASALTELPKVVGDLNKTIHPEAGKGTPEVKLVRETDIGEQASRLVGPYLEGLGTASIILILLLYLMINREDLSDRLIRLFGRGKISLTTRTIEEVGHRISKYLVMFATVNTAYGLVIGMGLWAIHLPYAVLWGFLGGALRFIPYAGPATAFAVPMLFSIASTKGWVTPLEVFALYAVAEVAMSSFLEPVIYGKTTGISALALLVAAMFWTWLWGAVGLLLSTPLTVCLAVLGKYVPSLGFFATFLREEVDLDPGVRFYQRLLAMDHDGATAVIESVLKKHPRGEAFDLVLVPTLAMAERDWARSDIDERELAFIHRVTQDVLDDLSGEPETDLATLSAAPPVSAAEASRSSISKVLALPAHDATDVLVLKMLALLLEPAGPPMTIVEEVLTPLEVVDRVAAESPDVVLISHLPPDGLTAARYLVRKIRARHPRLTILVGRWDEAKESEAASERLASAGASAMLGSLVQARDHLIGLGKCSPEPAGELAPSPAGA